MQGVEVPFGNEVCAQTRFLSDVLAHGRGVASLVEQHSGGADHAVAPEGGLSDRQVHPQFRVVRPALGIEMAYYVPQFVAKADFAPEGEARVGVARVYPYQQFVLSGLKQPPSHQPQFWSKVESGSSHAASHGNSGFPRLLGDQVNYDHQFAASRPYAIHALEHIDFRGGQPTGDLILRATAHHKSPVRMAGLLQGGLNSLRHGKQPDDHRNNAGNANDDDRGRTLAGKDAAQIHCRDVESLSKHGYRSLSASTMLRRFADTAG